MTDVRLGHYYNDGERWEFAVGLDGIARTAHSGPDARRDAIDELPSTERAGLDGGKSVPFATYEDMVPQQPSTQAEDVGNRAPLVLTPVEGKLPVVVFGQHGEAIGTFDDLSVALDEAADWDRGGLPGP